MSLTVDGVWKVGAWATTVWADGVWHEGAVQPPAEQQPPVGGGYVDDQYWQQVNKDRLAALDAVIQREFEKTVVSPTPEQKKRVKKFKRFIVPEAQTVDFKALEQAAQRNKALLQTYRELIAAISRQVAAEQEAERLRLDGEAEEYLLLVLTLRRRGRLNIH